VTYKTNDQKQRYSINVFVSGLMKLYGIIIKYTKPGDSLSQHAKLVISAILESVVGDVGN
jgi:hypothetical protein